MKTIRKMMALMIAVIMCIAMSSAVFAATDRTDEKDGSISVSGTLEGQTYTLYKLFDADMGANNAITYTTSIDLTGNEWFELNSNGFVVAKDGVEDDWANFDTDDEQPEALPITKMPDITPEEKEICEELSHFSINDTSFQVFEKKKCL